MIQFLITLKYFLKIASYFQFSNNLLKTSYTKFGKCIDLVKKKKIYEKTISSQAAALPEE